MKMRSLTSAAVVFGVMFFAHSLQSQEKQAQTSLRSFSGSIVEPPKKPEQPRTADLKQTYLDLITAQAALMDEATLQEEIKVTQRNIDELKALQQLGEARRLLLAITAEYPRTEAASQATKMLDSIEPPNAQAGFGDDVGPALNANAGLPFTRSSFQRTLPPDPPGKKSNDVPPKGSPSLPRF